MHTKIELQRERKAIAHSKRILSLSQRDAYKPPCEESDNEKSRNGSSASQVVEGVERERVVTFISVNLYGTS